VEKNKEVKDDLLGDFLKILQVNFDNPELSLFTLSQLTNLSEIQISKLLKNEYNQSFKQYLNDVRMTRAKQLLLETELSIKEIIFKSGYKTSSHFFRIFKDQEGISPSEFRILARNE
jgi:AraC-like DNA-binding protein